MSYNPNDYTRCERCKHIDRENEECKITNDKWLVSDRAGTCHQFEGVKSMKVRCITESFLNLTLDKEYVVMQMDCDFFYIRNDLDLVDAYSRDGFEVIGEKVKKPKQRVKKLEENPHEKLVKEFEEQMEKVRDLASKCGTSGEELFINELEDKHSFRCVTDEMFDLYNIKNKNYGNSFGKSYEEYGLIMVCIRLEDKLRRLKSLNKQGENANTDDESIRDTLIDLANYSVMAIMELDKEKS